MSDGAYDEYGWPIHAVSDEVPFHCANECPWDEDEKGRKCPQRHWCPWCGDCEYCYEIGPHEWD